VGVGTTNWFGRNGELLPDGTAAALHYWWADPDPPTYAAIHDLADWRTDAALGGEPYLPFVGLAVGDPAAAVTLQVEDVDDVHGWLAERLAAEGIALAGEVEPGLAVGRLIGGPFAGLAVITKAGGFGDPETLARIEEALT
jgi:hypothetical protein